MLDSLGPFLYRRFARWIWCELRLPEGNGSAGHDTVRLRSKWEVASFQDVFCHPFYWKALLELPGPPRLVVDAGAHCGHFSVLADTCARTLFPGTEPQYVLIEPNPWLQPILSRTLAAAGLEDRATIHQGMLGGQSGAGKLWVDPTNFLSSGQEARKGRTAIETPLIDLQQILPEGPIDLMKLDIEGAEFDFVAQNPQVMERVNLLVAEVHGDRSRYDGEFVPNLGRTGLTPVGDPLPGSWGWQLAIFRRT